MDGCMDTEGRATRRPAGSRLEGPYEVGLEAGWGMRVPSQLVEPVPEAYTETRAAPACTQMETQSLWRSIEQKMDPRRPRGFPWGFCAILPRKWGDAGASRGAPPSPLPSSR